MIQATDGNWYGYFADRKQAQIADSTVGLAGKGLDFGTLCSRSTSVLGFGVTDTEGIAIPVSGTSIGGENGLNPPNQISNECSFSSTYYPSMKKQEKQMMHLKCKHNQKNQQTNQLMNQQTSQQAHSKSF